MRLELILKNFIIIYQCLIKIIFHQTFVQYHGFLFKSDLIWLVSRAFLFGGGSAGEEGVWEVDSLGYWFRASFGAVMP